MAVSAVGGELARPESAAEELIAALVGRMPPPPAQVLAGLQAACAGGSADAARESGWWAAVDAWLSPCLLQLHGPWPAEPFRRRAAATALAARAFAEAGGASGAAAMAFAAGALLKIGQLALYYCFPKAYERAIGRAASSGGILGAERDVLGIDHALAGKRLAEHWGFPQAIREIIWLWQRPAASTAEPLRPIMEAVQRADQHVRQTGIGWPDFLALGVDLAPLRGDSPALANLQAATSQLLTNSPSAHSLHAESAEATARPAGASRSTGGWREALQEFFASAPGAGVAGVCAALARATTRLTATPVAAAFAVEQNERTWPAALVGGEVQHLRIPPVALSTLAAGEFVTGEPTPAPDELVRAHHALARAFAGRTPTAWLPLRQGGELIGGVLLAGGATTAAAADGWPLVASGFSAMLAAALAAERQRRMAEQLVLERPAGGERPAASGFSPLAAMAAGAAHELNTPLAVIAGRAQMLRQDANDARMRQDLQLISEHAQRASAIVSELLACAKPESPRAEPIRLGAWLEDVRQRWEAASGRAALQIAARISDDNLVVQADPAQLAEVFEALLANAVEASTGGNARITINSVSQPSDETIVVSIGDHGCGMPAEILARACDPFFSHRPAGRGRGLGLSRASRLIEINRGRLWIDSTPGEGTTVHVALPGCVNPAGAS